MLVRRLSTFACTLLGCCGVLAATALAQETPSEIPIVVPRIEPEAPAPNPALNRNSNGIPPPEEIKIGTVGHRMVAANNRRAGARGGGAFAQSGNVPVGKLSAKNTDSGAESVLGLRSLDVAVQIEGVAARTTVKHVFQNDTSSLLEGVFTFALPCDVAVDRFAMTIQSENDLMEGSLVDGNVATGTYNLLVYGVGIDPGKLEWLGNNLFRATIFPILPNRTKTIVVSYLQALQPSLNYEGVREMLYRYPLSAEQEPLPASICRFEARFDRLPPGTNVHSNLGARFIPGPDGSMVLAAQFDAQNPPAENEWVICAKNERPEKAQTGSLWLQAHRPDAGKDGYYMLTVTPELGTPGTPEALDVIFMVDTSASRSAADHQAAIKLLEATLKELKASDRFGVMAFDIATQPMPGGYLAPNQENIKKAISFLESIRPLGATDLANALQGVQQYFGRTDQRPLRVVLIGDARATYGVQDTQALRAAGDELVKHLDAELYGVCATAPAKRTAVAHTIEVEELARLLGAPVVSLNPEVPMAESGAAVARLLSQRVLRHARLEMRDASGQLLNEMVPQCVGGIAVNTASTFCGTYAQAGAATVTLTGAFGGEPYRQTWSVALPASEAANAPVVKLWARARIGELLGLGSDAEAIALAKAQRILSKGTSFLVLESEQMYHDFNIKRDRDSANLVANSQQLRSKFLAGTPVRVAAVEEEKAAAAPLTADAITGIRLAGDTPLTTSTREPVLVGGTWFEISLQGAQTVEKQKPGTQASTTQRKDDALDRNARIERRLTLSRLIAAERSMPFEPETVFTHLWITALPVSVSQTAALQAFFNPGADSLVWKVVEEQPLAAPQQWRLTSSSSQVTGVGMPVGGSSISSGQLSDLELQIHTLMNPEKCSTIKFAPDGSLLQLDTHLLAHQLFGTLLSGKDVGFFKASGSREVVRVATTRRVLTYPLTNVPPERLTAALLFLAEVAVVEHQSEVAEQLAERALRTAKKEEPNLNLAFLIQGLAAQLRGSFAAGSEYYCKLLEKPAALPKTGRDLTYRALVTTMAQGGNLPGTVLALERWCAEQKNNKELTQQLAHAYLLAHRPEDAIRALEQGGAADGFNIAVAKQLANEYLKANRTQEAIRALSTPAEFLPALGKEYQTPDGFLKLLDAK